MKNPRLRGVSFVAGMLAVGAIAMGANPASAQIINGGFENPGISGWGLYTNIQGWTATVDKIEIGQGSSTYSVVGATGQVLELDANRNATVQQSLVLSAGTYDLSFQAARRLQGMSGKPVDTADFQVLWNNSVVGTYRPANNTMSGYSLALNALAGSNTLAFRGWGTSDSYGALIDNVSLVARPGIGTQDVPEPGAVALGAGMSVFAGALIRRRKKA